MKTIIRKGLTVVILITSAVITLFADETAVPSKITQVTVYRQYAKLTNAAIVNLPAGISTIVLEKLTPYINANTIQVKLSNPVRLLSVSFRTNYLSEPINSKAVTKLSDSVIELNYQLAWNRDQQYIYQGEQKMIEDNKQVYNAQQIVTVGNLSGLVEYYHKRLFEIRAELLKLKRNETLLTERISRLQAQISQLSTTNSKNVGEIVLELATPNAVNADIDFTYMVTSAGWTPSYEIRSDGTDKPVMISYKANVYQNTGLDWKNVKMVICTGNPASNSNLPVFYPRYLQIYSPVVVQKYKREVTMSEKPSTLKKDANVETGDYYWEEETKVTENQLNVEFDIPLKYNIPSDGKTHLVSMKDFALNAEYEYNCLPGQDRGVFLVASLTDWSKLNLIQGNANIFFENTYIGQTVLNPFISKDTMVISFGKDEKIIVEREKLVDFASVKFFGASKKVSYVFEITAKNTKNIPAKIKVIDQLPVSRINEIEVETGNLSGAEYDQETGRLTWKIDLKPGETRKIKFEYSVKYPKDKIISGLE